MGDLLLKVAGGGCEFFYSRDGAGFHQRDTAPDLPPNIRLITLPPYKSGTQPGGKTLGHRQRRSLQQTLRLTRRSSANHHLNPPRVLE